MTPDSSSSVGSPFKNHFDDVRYKQICFESRCKKLFKGREILHLVKRVKLLQRNKYFCLRYEEQLQNHIDLKKK